MTTTNTMEMTAHRGRHFLFDLVFPLLLLAAGTLLFRLTRLDLILQNQFYGAPGLWTLEYHPVFRLIYLYGNIPALLTALTGLYLVIRSYRSLCFLRWRKVGFYLLLSLLLGPGLLVNVILKDNWGRPRPREIVQFGGRFEYEELLTVDPASPGKSFPCGHATMGFYFFGLYFLLRGRRKPLAALIFVFALLYGALIGMVRLAGGGHFASDVLWAGVLVWLVCAGLFYLLKLHRGLWYERAVQPAKLSWYSKIALYLIGLVLVLGVAVATPYSRHRSYIFDHASQIELDLLLGELSVFPSDISELFVQNSGFGIPGSKLILSRQKTSDSLSVHYLQRKKGWFTELGSRMELALDSLRVNSLKLSVRKGRIGFRMPGSLPYFDLEVGEGEVDLELPRDFKGRIYFSGGAALKSGRSGLLLSSDPKSPYRVKIDSGTLVIR